MQEVPASETLSLEPYDVNFCFPVRELENNRIKLVPFIPSVHAEAFFAASEPHPEIYTHLPFGPFGTLTHLEELLEARIRHDPGMTLFAVIDKTLNGPIGPDSREGTLAGTIGFLNTSIPNLCTEIGLLMILPPFQRTHVTSNAIGLLLHYALDLPACDGLGLRRVVWQANALNGASIRAAERMGFTKEALLRWERVLPAGKVGNGGELRRGDPREGYPEKAGEVRGLWNRRVQSCERNTGSFGKIKMRLREES